MLLAACLTACNSVETQFKELEKAIAAQDYDKADEIYESIDVTKIKLNQTARWTEVSMKYSAMKTQQSMEEAAKHTQELMQESAKQLNNLFGF